LKLREALGYIFDFCCEDVEKENTISISSRREGDKIFLEIFEKGKKFDIETITTVPLFVNKKCENLCAAID